MEPKAFLENYRKQFEDCKNEFLDHFKGDLRLEQKFVDRIERLIDYNCHGGKNNRARSLVRMVKSISENQKKPFNAKLKQKTYVLACCIEILQSSLLVADDIADNSSLRRGKPCWYKCEDIKMDAVNDSYILESLVYFILKKHFSEEPIYVRLVDLHRDVILKTQIGQMIDLSFKGYPKNVKELCQRFSYKNFESIITFKTAYYTYFIPIMDALLLCGMHSKEQENAALKIAIELGKKFQIQDDFIDCYGDPSELGKIGKDIEENKCTWLVVKALEKATEAQKKIILVYRSQIKNRSFFADNFL
ncbi:hypothetical protein MHBO_002735 [Bonamia ostreae]|uniref:Farnesyl diphosphate synthase n=1 Tax=Bonamia ostreae TaxID=126728 RepID=A0ABV2ANA9_9EUKA